MEKIGKQENLIDIIRYPIITDKTTKTIENNVYYFKVKKSSNKNQIKKAIENIFDVKVQKVNTMNNPPKHKTVGRFKGKVTQYKKAIVKLQEKYSIQLFEDQE